MEGSAIWPRAVCVFAAYSDLHIGVEPSSARIWALRRLRRKNVLLFLAGLPFDPLLGLVPSLTTAQIDAVFATSGQPDRVWSWRRLPCRSLSNTRAPIKTATAIPPNAHQGYANRTHRVTSKSIPLGRPGISPEARPLNQRNFELISEKHQILKTVFGYHGALTSVTPKSSSKTRYPACSWACIRTATSGGTTIVRSFGNLFGYSSGRR